MQAFVARTLLAIASVLVCCALADAQDRPSLTATLELVGPRAARSASELRLRAVVRNDAHQDAELPVVPLSTAQLCVEVRDASSGRRMPTIPPPVPRPGDDRREVLRAGESRTFELALGVFSPALPAGRYEVRWGGCAGIRAAPVEMTIAP